MFKQYMYNMDKQVYTIEKIIRNKILKKYHRNTENTTSRSSILKWEEINFTTE